MSDKVTTDDVLALARRHNIKLHDWQIRVVTDAINSDGRMRIAMTPTRNGRTLVNELIRAAFPQAQIVTTANDSRSITNLNDHLEVGEH